MAEECYALQMLRVQHVPRQVHRDFVQDSQSLQQQLAWMHHVEN